MSRGTARGAAAGSRAQLPAPHPHYTTRRRWKEYTPLHDFVPAVGTHVKVGSGGTSRFVRAADGTGTHMQTETAFIKTPKATHALADDGKSYVEVGAAFATHVARKWPAGYKKYIDGVLSCPPFRTYPIFNNNHDSEDTRWMMAVRAVLAADPVATLRASHRTPTHTPVQYTDGNIRRSADNAAATDYDRWQVRAQGVARALACTSAARANNPPPPRQLYYADAIAVLKAAYPETPWVPSTMALLASIPALDATKKGLQFNHVCKRE